ADALPPVLAQAWGLARTPQRGPKPELSVEAIVDAAVQIADAEGLEAVTMARVARELGFTPMSLYRHVASKDDLVQLMNDAAFDIAIPSPEESAGASWRETLAAWTRAVRRHYLRHPWKLDIPISGVPNMPNAVRLADWALRGMRDLPLTDAERISLLLTLSALAHAFARMDVQLVRAAQQHGDEQVLGVGLDRALGQVITAEKYPDIHRLIAAGAYFGTGPDGPTPGVDLGEEDRAAPTILEFEYALTLVLEGLEARIRAARADPE
ncbi:MAG: TetR family transcriptional regulator, partial [Micromonosporaceae bacterium]|nr:TetR family transcriptional regulator [Micromonosporaceae bacterium]